MNYASVLANQHMIMVDNGGWDAGTDVLRDNVLHNHRSGTSQDSSQDPHSDIFIHIFSCSLFFPLLSAWVYLRSYRIPPRDTEPWVCPWKQWGWPWWSGHRMDCILNTLPHRVRAWPQHPAADSAETESQAPCVIESVPPGHPEDLLKKKAWMSSDKAKNLL